jgi:hypothetical protein
MGDTAMANTFAPNGFQQYQGTGATPSYEQTQLAIASGNITPIFFGDPVVQATNTTGIGTGYIAQASSSGLTTLAVSGIVVTAGVAVATFTALSAAPAVGSYVAFTGTSFATGGGFNGTYQITASSTTTITFNVPGAFSSTLTFGTATVFTPVAGVFVGCKYLSTAQKRTVFSNYWPGSDANGDVTAYVITDPNAQFIVQTANSNTTASAVGLASVGQNISFNYNDSASTGEANGNTANGLSTYFADQYTLSANGPGGYTANSLLPFRIIGLANYVPGQTSPLVSINGNDPTTAYNKIIVGFNNSMPRGFAGI